jgi:hypothetical protein
VVAQQGGVNSGGPAPTSSSSLGAGSSSSGFTNTGPGSSSNAITSGGSGSSQLQGTPLATMEPTPKLTKPTGTAASSLQKSNFLAGYYANPYFQGQISSQTNAVPGGFGTVLYPVTGGTGSVTSGGRGTIGGGIAGLNQSRGGIGGQNANNQSGIIIPIPTPIAYTAQMQFSAPPLAPTRLQSDLRLAIDGTTMIANPKAVQIITDAKNNVTLRGTVKDDDEVRLIEGMVRLTPGVGDIKNELTPTVTTSRR